MYPDLFRFVEKVHNTLIPGKINIHIKPYRQILEHGAARTRNMNSIGQWLVFVPLFNLLLFNYALT